MAYEDEYYDDEFMDEEEDFPIDEEEDWVDAAVKATPWWAISVGTHVILILIAAALIISAEMMEKPDANIVALEPEDEEEMKIEPPRDIFDNKKIIQGEQAVEDPARNLSRPRATRRTSSRTSRLKVPVSTTQSVPVAVVVVATAAASVVSVT
jgi:hypothetical protein